MHLLIKNGLRKQQNDVYSTMNHILYSTENHKIIAIGASLTKNNINTLIVDSIQKVNSYNAGIYGLGLVETKMVLECYLNSKHPKPDLILMTLPEDLIAKKSEMAYPSQFYPYMDIYNVSNTLKKYDPNSFILNWFSFLALMKYNDHIKYVALIPYIKPNHAKSNIFKGYEALDGAIKDPSKYSSINATKLSVPADHQQLSYFYDICMYAYVYKIKLIVILTPSFKTVLSSIQSPLALHLKKKQHLWHFSLVDYSQDSICLDPSLFMNRLHLNARGSKKITIKIAKNL
jgi:hypothetical protein